MARKGGEELEFPRAQVNGTPVMAKATSDEIEIEAFGHRQLGSIRGARAGTISDLSTGRGVDIQHRIIVRLDR